MPAHHRRSFTPRSGKQFAKQIGPGGKVSCLSCERLGTPRSEQSDCLLRKSGEGSFTSEPINPLMAKNRRRKGIVAIPIQGSEPLLTLADQSVLTEDALGGNLTEDFYAISCDVSMSMRSLTAGEGDPMTAIFAHGDYSDSEIAEALTVKLLGPGNKIEQERQRRLVRKIGVFHQEGDQVDTFTSMNMRGKGGSPNPRVKLGFVIQSGKTLNIGVQNRSGGALTTGALYEWDGMLYGRWYL